MTDKAERQRIYRLARGLCPQCGKRKPAGKWRLCKLCRSENIARGQIETWRVRKRSKQIAAQIENKARTEARPAGPPVTPAELDALASEALAKSERVLKLALSLARKPGSD